MRRSPNAPRKSGRRIIAAVALCAASCCILWACLHPANVHGWYPPACTAQHAQQQAALYFEGGPKYHSNCPPWAWLHVLAATSESHTYIDIGCNRGYSSAKIFSVRAPSLKFTADRIHASTVHMEGIPQDHTCGACGDCKEARVLVLGGQALPRPLLGALRAKMNITRTLRLMLSWGG